ncbi:hypothetical protein K2173_001933 [Erythroxylum novogranatense]|uniref:Glycosyltransferase n=1 Tax=Erythroxylum novogranatense TaxID=1862640 RepID=A0AAV8SQ31_9ROSI|nr:hypothetical protein K2173_001933 [Erythroxylum novogranatense]
MASQTHFVLIPFLSQGHIIPMIDIAKLLAQRNVIVTIFTTPLNAARNLSLDRAVRSGLPIHVVTVPFPATEAGLPEGCESVEILPLPSLTRNFVRALDMLHQPVELLFRKLTPSPSCLIADKTIPWTADLASKFHIPRLIFDGTSCFTALCSHNLHVSKVYETAHNSEPFLVPGLPDQIEFTRAQLPGYFNPGQHLDLKEFRDKVRATEAEAYGNLINSFEELEVDYVKAYKRVRGDKVWTVGPVSLCNTEELDKAQRGNKASTDENLCLKWLDSQEAGSVIYACLGSLNRMTPTQLVELGLALEASNRPFIWVIRGGHKKEEMDKWIIESGYEERVKGRSFLIRGWAPQVLILSHQAIGGFLTHCGWNSTLEGICAGLPMVTWPIFAEQFYNEKLVVQLLDIGVRVGAEVVVHIGDEDKHGVLVKWKQIRDAIDEVMSQEKEGEKRRERAMKLSKMAKKAVEAGGSSHLNINLLIDDIMQHIRDNHIKAWQ